MYKMFVKMLINIAVCASTAAAFAQTLTTTKLADTAVNLVIPKGHCIIPRDDELGALHYKLQEDGNKGQNKVAILFADCREWAQRKKNPSLLLHHHGNYLFQLIQGQERLLPPAISRAELVKIYVDHDLKSNVSDHKDLAERARRNLASSSVPSAPIQGNVNLGLIDWDGSAAYMGVGITFVYEGKPVRSIGVVGATTTRSVPITINLYGPPRKGNPFRELLAQQKEMVRQLIAANE